MFKTYPRYTAAFPVAETCMPERTGWQGALEDAGWWEQRSACWDKKLILKLITCENCK